MFFPLQKHRRPAAHSRAHRQKRLAEALFQAASPSVINGYSANLPATRPFIAYLEQGLQDRVEDFFQPILDNCGFNRSDDTADSIISLVEVVANYIKNETEREFSMDDVYEALCAKNGVAIEAGKIPVNVKQGMLCLFGYLTMLFNIPKAFSDDTLDISEPRNPLIMSTQRPIENTGHAIGRLLNTFVSIVPRPTKKPLPSVNNWHPRQLRSLELSTSVMNVHAFTKIGKITLVWSSLLSAHLIFDEKRRTLMLFRFPSFCALNCCPLEKRTLFNQWVGPHEQIQAKPRTDTPYSILDDDSGPEGPTVMAQDVVNRSMFQETLLTYRLLFGQNRHSQWLYRTKEKKRASANGQTDPLLNRLCGDRKDISNLTEEDIFYEEAFYDSAIDFPNYEKRLTVLHNYISPRKPQNVMDLWRDRRDLERWVVIWFVIILTIVTVVQSAIQIILGGFQVKIGNAQVRLSQAQLEAQMAGQ
ncbi:MAG: hypothetical protein Q9213_004896 [Squamulea squamosa]